MTTGKALGCDFAMYERWQDALEGMVRIVTIDGARAGAEVLAGKIGIIHQQQLVKAKKGKAKL